MLSHGQWTGLPAESRGFVKDSEKRRFELLTTEIPGTVHSGK